MPCPTRSVTPGSRCKGCARAMDRQRGSRSERGYGPEHRAARGRLARTLPRPCGYCDQVVTADERWVAAHVVDGDPTRGWMVAHPDCNERAKRRWGVIEISGSVDPPA